MSETTDARKPLDLVTAMGQLLTKAALRARFSASPGQVADELNIARTERAAFLSLDPEQLQRQATTLLNKRWHEVVALIPGTIGELGDDAREVFMFYANQNWPSGHRRHPLDALRFLQFLQQNKILKPSGFEMKRIRKMVAT